MNCKITREDGSFEIINNYKYGKWDVINQVRAKDKNRDFIDLTDIAAEVSPCRGYFELIYLSDMKRYYLEIT